MADEEPRESKALDDELEREIEAALGDTSLLGVGHPSKAPAPAGAADVLDVVPEPGSFSDALVAGAGEEDVFVEFGPRAQGVIPAAQFGAPPTIGDRIRVYVERFDVKEGLFLCALKRALHAASGWDSVEVGSVVNATVRADNKGGLDVQVGHLSAFLPASHADLGHIEDLSTLVGQTFPVEVIESDPDRRRLVVSRRAVLAREREVHAAATLETLQPGDIVTGTVTRVQPFGAFVDLGGVEGLLHVSQMAWKRVEDPETVVKTGDVIKVQVLSIEEGGKRIGLGLKQLTEDPWFRVTKDHPPGSVLKGKVSRLAPYGAFIEIADGIDGLAHVSQLAPHPVNHPREIVRPGDEVTVRIASIEPERRRIALSLLTERGDRLTDDVADDATIREVMERSQEEAAEPTLGDLLRKAMREKPE
ncbi:MAG: 30S ribosomal protein S1 [Planctomycetota bacterium]